MSNYFYVTLMSIIMPVIAFTQASTLKTYFDKAGKITSESNAYYYRTGPEQQDHFKSYYVNGDAIYYEGRILKAHPVDENRNIYTGTSTWYYKNGKKKAQRNFSPTGEEEGKSVYYYESGKIWKEIEYSKGKIVDNRIKEYDEEGQASRIFEEDFLNNSNDWDLYVSDKSSAVIAGGFLVITSLTEDGTSRFISVPSQSSDFAVEATIKTDQLKEGEKTGLLFGFKDWQNYNFFFISNSSIYIGTVYEGVSAIKADGMFSSAIQSEAPNNIKVIAGDKNYYSINGEIQFSSDRTKNFGSNTGFAVSGKSTISVDKLIYKEIDFKPSGSNVASNKDLDVKATGSGLILSSNGYIITNNHVIEDADRIAVEANLNGVTKTYNATLIQKDVDNDIAILRIDDQSFTNLSPLNYSFKETGGVDVGASVFTIGYPYALNGMGKEAKFTDGKISSKTGYNNALNMFQTSIPVQPGNSGGPLFNSNGELIGIINATFKGADNVSYAIKLNYIRNLIDLLPESIELPNNKGIANLTLEEKVKMLSNYVVLIKIR